jgi:WD40 repeat protein/DNA-binding SARP family transcriptional activator/energy-coupling factor transporter ATP-binding protein EcfA2
MEFRILGPLEVRNDRGAVELRGIKPRAVLTVLLLHANEPVTAEQLAVALWGDEAPAGATKTVHVHVSRLRKALGDADVLTTTPAGYQLRVAPQELDAARFERLALDGRRALAAGRPEQAARLLDEALGLWRGPPLAELTFEAFAQTAIARLEEQRLAALEARVDADLAAGRHVALVGELQTLVDSYPSRERFAGQLMLALYRCGRQADALDAYSAARGRLVEEIGVEPGPELRRLHDAILRQDASLDAQPIVADLPRELDADVAPPLLGRDADLIWLAEHWARACIGAGALVAITGAAGSGKTRLVAELTGDVKREGGQVVYASGAGPATALMAAVARAREALGPTLLIVDDADRADADGRAALSSFGGAVTSLPVLAVATGRDPQALAGLPSESVIILDALDLDAVRGIASLYAPSWATEAIPAEDLLSASDGVPRRVHEVASQWARHEAARRVGSAATRTADRRADLRSVESELAGGVVALEEAQARIEATDDVGAPVVCPFKGLASFEASDASYFFGRERLVAELIARLVGAPLLGVVGPSGSGKSSVLQAGLLPALRDGVLPGSDQWRSVILRPGERPADALSLAVRGIDEGPRLVLAVDQFEEVFTACRDEGQRAEFVAQLVHLAQARATVILAIRADQYGNCAEFPDLSGLLAANHVLVGPMRREELRRAVERPAARAGLRVEPDLVDALIADVEGQPGALPLLSAALLELWQRRDGRRLALASYEQTGGVHGAVGRLAEDAYRELDPGQQSVARDLLLTLVAEGDGGAVERRRVPLAQLEIDGREDLAPVVSGLADRRLLTLSDGTVEVAHEALLREWPRLRSWIEEHRERIRIHHSLHAAALEWLAHDRNEDWLYRGSPLMEAREWEEQGGLGLSGDEREFLAASRDHARRGRVARRRRVAIVIGALVLALVVITVVALQAVSERRDADRQRNLAVSRSLALQSEKMVASDPELAVSLALWALDTAPTKEAGVALRQAVPAFHPYTTPRARSLDAATAAYSPDGTRVVTGGKGGTATVWDAAAGREQARLAARRGPVQAARWAPAGDRIVLGFGDGTVVLTDGSLRAPKTLLQADGTVSAVAFSADGRRVAAALSDGTVRVVSADGSGAPLSLNTHDAGGVRDVDLSRDGSRVVTAGDDGSVQLWDAARGGVQPLKTTGDHPETDVDFSPDDSTILAVGEDERVRLFDARTGEQRTSFDGQGRKLESAAFSADGRRFATGGRDGVVRIWTEGVGEPVTVLRGQRSRVEDVGFGRGGNHVVSTGEDGSVRMWDAGNAQAWALPAAGTSAGFDRAGSRVVTGSDDGTARIYDAATGRLQSSLPGQAGAVMAAFSPTSDEVMVLDASGVRLWRGSGDAARGVIKPPEGAEMSSAVFDASGNHITWVYVDDVPGAVVHDLVARTDVRLGGLPPDAYQAALAPDGRYAVVLGDSHFLAWRMDRPERPERALTGHTGPVNDVAFGDDGQMVTAGSDHTVRVWDSRGRTTAVMRGFQDELTKALFADHDRQVLADSLDGTVRLFDARTGEALAVIDAPEAELYDLALSHDGRIATLGSGEVVRVAPCDFCGSLRQVSARALSRHPRPLTVAERRAFLSSAG